VGLLLDFRKHSVFQEVHIHGQSIELCGYEELSGTLLAQCFLYGASRDLRRILKV